jgi:three-Cys-motif partner protein
MGAKLDEVGYWSELKLEIVQKYASAYATIMQKQKAIRSYYYIDAFAGAGVHISKTSNDYIAGSPLNALLVQPRFSGYIFIDLDGGKASSLKALSKDNQEVSIFEGDCNGILCDKVFPSLKYTDFKRALCLLDPYGLHIQWEVMRLAGELRTIEIFLNFPMMDMNRNILWGNPDKVKPQQVKRMNAFWGDESWRKAAYASPPRLFEDREEKTTNEAVVKAFRDRLISVAGFKYVPEALPMRNSKGAVVYYLLFASPNETGGRIVREIFNSYRNRG